MDIRNWCNSGSRTIQLGRCSDEVEDGSSLSPGSNGSSKLKWKMLWLKFKKEKKRLFESTTPPLNAPSYDPHTYSKNFDQGTAPEEPDNLSRSFSARFADPSRLLLKKG